MRRTVWGRYGLLGASLMLLGACAAWPPGGLPMGTPIAQARSSWMGPDAEYGLSGGGTRLEFDQGAQTYMLDFDASGLLVASRQVLTPDNFEGIVVGMPEQEVRLRLGRPVHTFSIPRQQLQVLNYRFVAGDCIWFQVSVQQETRLVTAAATGPDPRCDGPSPKE